MPQLRGALLTVLATGLMCGPLITFCPVLVRDALQGDVSQFSLSIGAFGIGGLLGAAGLAGRRRRGRDLRRVSTRFAAALWSGRGADRAQSPGHGRCRCLLVLAGLSMNVSNTSANSVLQAAADPRMRGQTVSLYMLALRGGLSIGSLATGVAVSYLGVRYALLIDGALALVLQIMVGRDWLRPAALPAGGAGLGQGL